MRRQRENRIIRIEDLLICPAKAVRHALVKLEDLHRKKPSSQLLINSI
jgi:hypothetical protein